MEAISGALKEISKISGIGRKKMRRVRSSKLTSFPIAIHKPAQQRLPRRPWSPYSQPQAIGADEPRDIDTGQATRIASIRFDPIPPRPAHANIRIEVFCPPYQAPANGTVTYRGRTFRGATAPAPAVREIWRPFEDDCCGDGDRAKAGGGGGGGGLALPLAVDGDIPAGDAVRLACDPHFRLAGPGSPAPACLPSGRCAPGREF